MTQRFTSIVVPFDGSPAAKAGLEYAIALAGAGGRLILVSVIDSRIALTPYVSPLASWDPAPMLSMLEERTQFVMQSALDRCGAAGLAATRHVVHETPVHGIRSAAERYDADLIVIGTQARAGLPRAFLGSTAEGVIRSSLIPVLAVHADAPAPPAGDVFAAGVLVALDDSSPSDAAALVASRFVAAYTPRFVACGVVDSETLYERAATYGYDPGPLASEMRAHARAVVEAALGRAAFAVAVAIRIVEGKPAGTIVETARSEGVGAIVIGSHGRRGVQRLLLGSVAEAVLRSSHVPVLIVRAEPAR